MDLNDTIDDEDTLCIPSLDNIQPYQFEPMAEMSSNATEMSEISDHSDVHGCRSRGKRKS